jgi:hypothetical protein
VAGEISGHQMVGDKEASVGELPSSMNSVLTN